MKFLRPTLIALAVLLGVLGAVLLVAMVPAVQRWYLLRQLAAVPGLKAEVQSFVAGFDRVTLIGVRVERNGRAARVDRLEADYSLWALLARDELHLAKVEARGVFFDVSRLSPAKAQAGAVAGPAALPGVLARLELPWLIRLDALSLDGTGRLPAAPGRPAIETKFTVTGGGVAPGQTGEIKVLASLRDPSPGAAVAGLRAQLGVAVAQGPDRKLRDVALQAVVDPESAAFAAGDQLQIAAALRRTEAGEKYEASVSTGLGADARKLLSLDATLPGGQPAFAGEWHLDASSAQIQPYYLGGPLPEFAAAGQGTFTFNPRTGAVAVEGRLDATASALEYWQPRLRPLGAVRLNSGFNLAREGDVISLNRLELTVGGAKDAFAITAHRAARLDLARRTLELGPAESGEALRLTLHGLPLAWVRPFLTAADVSGGVATGEIALVSEGGRATARTVRPLAVDSLSVVVAGRPLLLDAAAAASFDASALGAEWRVALRDFNIRLPSGDSVRASGLVNFQSGPAAALSVKADYETVLPKIADRFLPGLGAVRTRGNLDAAWRGSVLDVTAWSERISDFSGQPMLGVEALRMFQFDLAANRPVPVAGGERDILRIDLQRTPLAALLLGRRPPHPLSGVVEGAEFIVGLKQDAVQLRTTRPGRAAGLAYGPADAPWLRGLAVEFSPSAEWSPASATARSGDIRVRGADGAELATLTAEAAFQPGKEARGSCVFQANLPAWAAQPVFSRIANVAQGRAGGELRAVLAADGAGRLEARTTINGLVARQGGGALPVANLTLNATLSPEGRVTVDAPLLLDRSGERSDARLEAVLARAAGAFTGDARITGEKIALDDILTVLGVFAGPLALATPSQSAAREIGSVTVPDERPAWAGFGGKLAVDIKSVTSGADWAMSNLQADLSVTEQAVNLSGLRADFGADSKLRAQGRLTFAPGERPYQLGADFTLTDFDAGKLFRALDNTRAPSVEGIFSTQGRLTAAGRTVDDMLAHWRGTADLTSRQGVFRGLKRGTDKVSTATKAVELGAVLGTFFGTDKVRDTAEKIAGNAYLVDQLATALGEFKYDQLVVRLARDHSPDVDIDELRLLAPELRLAGKGVITHDPAKGLLERPLRFSTTLAARGPIEELLGRLRVLEAAKDDLGYSRMRDPIFVGGTLARPDPAQFFARLAASRLTDFLAPNRPPANPPPSAERPKP